MMIFFFFFGGVLFWLLISWTLEEEDDTKTSKRGKEKEKEKKLKLGFRHKIHNFTHNIHITHEKQESWSFFLSYTSITSSSLFLFLTIWLYVRTSTTKSDIIDHQNHGSRSTGAHVFITLSNHSSSTASPASQQSITPFPTTNPLLVLPPHSLHAPTPFSGENPPLFPVGPTNLTPAITVDAESETDAPQLSLFPFPTTSDGVGKLAAGDDGLVVFVAGVGVISL